MPAETEPAPKPETETEQEVLLARLSELQERLEEAEETLRALRNGEVDAVVAAGPDGPRIYSLRTADESYRLLIEQMAEGAVTLASDGLILFSNERFANTVEMPLERIIGARIQDFVEPLYADVFRALLERGRSGEAKSELRLKTAAGRSVPAYVSMNPLPVDGVDAVCAIVTDLTEQKRNEEIIAAGQLARSILDQAAEAILVIDPEGRIVRASRATDKLAGTAAVWRRFDDVLRLRQSATGADYPFQKILEKVRRGEIIEGLEVTAFTPDKRRFELLLSAAALSGADGRLLGAIVNLADITERKRIEATLRESEKRERRRAAELEAIMEAVPAATFIARDCDCRTILGSRMTTELLRLPPGSNTSFSVPEADRPQLCRFMRGTNEIPPDQWAVQMAARTGRTVRNYEFDLVYEDGSRRNLLGTAVPVFDDMRCPRGAIAAFLDITDRKSAEEKLRESEAQFSTLAEMVPGIPFTARADGMTDYLSTRCSQYTGMSMNALLGEGWMGAIHPEDRGHFQEEWAKAMASGEPLSTDLRYRRADGVYRWFQIRVTPMRNAERKAVRWFGLVTDVEDLKRLGSELEKRSQELARSNEELQRFAYAASHDLQEPLRTIGSMTALLSTRYRGKFDSEADRLLEFIDTGVHRMRTLIGDLLEFATVTEETARPKEPVDCNDLVDAVLENLREKISATGARIIRDSLPVIPADEQLGRVFQNLIGNALKYRGEKAPEIHISARRNGGIWLFSVQDNGIGIDMQHAEKIFRLFQRLHTRSEYEGTGLGLNISKRIVERHGGRIWVESVPGEGSVFYFTIPA